MDGETAVYVGLGAAAAIGVGYTLYTLVSTTTSAVSALPNALNSITSSLGSAISSGLNAIGLAPAGSALGPPVPLSTAGGAMADALSNLIPASPNKISPITPDSSAAGAAGSAGTAAQD